MLDVKNTDSVKTLVVAGGGTAGWMTAAAISRHIRGNLRVILVESKRIGSVGVGEATIPPLKSFHEMLGINEQEFMAATSATFKLGIQFNGWKDEASSYFHSFGTNGPGTLFAEFHHFQLRAQQLGIHTNPADFCAELKAAELGRFSTQCSPKLNYAYHLDASAYAEFLRQYSERNGVICVDGDITEISKAHDGSISGLVLKSGEIITGDFFIDCTGFKALLIEGALGAEFEDWSHWLPCDSAIAVQTNHADSKIPPYTKSSAHDAGWFWQIPLTSRAGNGIVYASEYLQDSEALNALEDQITGSKHSDFKQIRFKAGMRRDAWVKNCLAIGLSSGFLEPLESTSIHMIMTGITRFLHLFPTNLNFSSLAQQYNALTRTQTEQIRDFIILHYSVNNRSSMFWKDCANRAIPETLDVRIQLFKEHAHAFQTNGELFRVDSWVQVLIGQGVLPKAHHEIANRMNENDLIKLFKTVSNGVDNLTSVLPEHYEFLTSYIPKF